MRKRKIIRAIFCCLLMLWFAGQFGDSARRVMAAEKGSLFLENLEINDLVEVYRIASYAEATGKYNWATAVSNWMQNTTEGNVYRSLTPEKLSQMTDDRAEEFCEVLLMGLKNDSEGIANIPGYSFVIEEEQEQFTLDVTPGYYILLPKGTERIYSLKWLKVEPTEEITVSYLQEQGDYQIPRMTFSMCNTTADRGVNNETDAFPFTLADDELEFTADINIPDYPNMYSSGKRILNICIAVPRGICYTENSLSLKQASVELGEDKYSLQLLKDSIAYETMDGKLLFVGTINGYFYLPDGKLLLAAGTEQEALDKYNLSYGTEYFLDTDLPGEESVGEAAEDVTQTDKLAADSSELSLKKMTEMTVFIIALDTEAEVSDLQLLYRATKDRKGTDTGSFTNRLLLSYSTSPLDSNLSCVTERTATAVSYGIRITVCKGDGKSIGMTAEEILKEAPRMTGAGFYLYRLTNTYEGDTTSVTEQATHDSDEENMGEGDSTGTDISPQLIYNKEENKTYEYSYVTQLDVNENGVTEISGMEPEEYLIVQTKYPEGYTRSEEAILVSSTDWTDETVMEGNFLLDVLWLDYATVYLPGTGKTGILFFVLAGTLIAGVAVVAIAKRTYPGGMKYAYLICFYYVKLRIKNFFKLIVEKIRNL